MRFPTHWIRGFSRSTAAGVVVLLVVAAPCAARVVTIRHPHYGKALPLWWGCTSWQTFTVSPRAHIGPRALRYAERVVRDQSEQLQRAWGTPCARFAPGGWPIVFDGDPNVESSGQHVNPVPGGPPLITVWDGGFPRHWEAWLPAFSHEVVETLVDPLQWTYWNGSTFDQSGVMTVPDESIVEVADPVDLVTYRLDGANVSDFVTRAWYGGGPGPFDHARALHCAGELESNPG